MKRQYIFLATVVLMLASADGASALKWKVTASVSVRVIPTQGGYSNKTMATGFHRLILTEITAADILLPVRLRINSGELHRDGDWTDSCGTGWIWGWNATSAFCATNYTENDCTSAYWDAWTWGQVQLHPQGGQKQVVDGPRFADCECT